MSHSLLEEQQEMLALATRKKLNVELQSVKYYGIIVDEATDISKSEHMALKTWYCTDDYEVFRNLANLNVGRPRVFTDALFEYINV